MKNPIMALVLLALLPATLQADQGGTVRFTGKITSPACTIKHQDEGIISSCFGQTSTNGNGYTITPLNKISPELVSNVTTEMINNNDRLKNVTISYK
ncbi:hypothetical protein [Serratia proteamaculans]|jgi:type 1 fimbria pilin|uniref:hypothetical protein n=1 Tax=Serratia proteamaculans TaxID=28151 RepID=UPI003D001F83